MNEQANTVDVESIIQKIQITPQFQAIYDKTLLKGMRVMFDKKSHQLLLDEMDKEGPLAQKISQGVVGLIYMLFQQSNGTLPPQIVAPLGTTFVLRIFDFLQKSEEPEATPQVLGEAMDMTLRTLASKFGVPDGDIAKHQQSQGQGAAQPGGLLGGA